MLSFNLMVLLFAIRLGNPASERPLNNKWSFALYSSRWWCCYFEGKYDNIMILLQVNTGTRSLGTNVRSCFKNGCRFGSCAMWLSQDTNLETCTQYPTRRVMYVYMPNSVDIWTYPRILIGFDARFSSFVRSCAPWSNVLYPLAAY